MLGLQPYQRFVANAGAQIAEMARMVATELIQLPHTDRKGTPSAKTSAVKPADADHSHTALNDLDQQRD